jgi:CBS domain containing-hemolysin-like protein
MDAALGSNLLRLLGVAVLVLVNAFFVAAEYALVSVRPTRVEELLQVGRPGARSVKKALEQLDRFIAATQLGVTVASLTLGWLGEPALSGLLEPVLSLLPAAWVGVAGRTLSAIIAFTVITFLEVVVGELMPKAIALQRAEVIALWVARPTLIISLIFNPFISIVNGAGNFALRLLGLAPAGGPESSHSEEELRLLVHASGKSGALEEEQHDMLAAVFDFGELTAREAMVPRTEMIAMAADANLDEFILQAVKHPFSKFPIYEGDLDHIVGIANVKDLVRVQHDTRRTATVRGLLREALFVPDTIRLDALLQQFRARRQHIAIVLDEYSGTAGLVTLDDLVGRIVGDVADPFDKSGPDIQRLPTGAYLVDGLTNIEDVNDRLGLSLHDDFYDTIAGFVLGRLGRMARVGDTVEANGVRLKVEALDGLRISRLSVYPLAAEGADGKQNG